MEPDVVVIGGGAIGTTAALELARRGVRVTLLERGETLAAGCSAGNSGLICPSHSMPLASPETLRQGVRTLLSPDGSFLRPRVRLLPWLVRFAAACREERAETGERAIRALSLESLELHAGLAALGTSFERRGTLSVYETEAGFAAGKREAERSGLRAEILAPAEARASEPALVYEPAGAIYHPDEAHMDPLRYVRAVGDAAREAGAELRTRTEVLAVRRRAGTVSVETAGGELRPATIVLAAGVWTARLARALGVFVPLEGGKGYHVDLEPAPADPRVPVLLQEALTRTIATPLDGRLRLAGTLELAGLDLSIRPVRVEAIRRAAARVLGNQAGRRVLDVWSGLRPCTPDGLPVIGSPAAVPGLVLATGHAMKGLSLAPVTARLVAELVTGAPPSRDLSPFSPDRFRPLLPLRER
ncbi:MAG TPA: FAD-dependent oxidoreductase [Gaiellaceae bacterium]|jgi:D-amino-acid dehydrogenase